MPSNSITCPKCYKKIPVQPEPVQPEQPHMSVRNPKVALILDAVLGLFGLLGIGQIYMGERRGALFLLFGLAVFLPALVLTVIVPLISWILAVPLFVIYALAYIGALADLFMGSAIRNLRFRSSCHAVTAEKAENLRSHLCEMDRVTPSVDSRGIPWTKRIVRTADERRLVLGRPFEFRREPAGDRREKGQISCRIPRLEAQMLPEGIRYIVGRALFPEDDPLEIRYDPPEFGSRIQILGLYAEFG
mgnify:FL=1